MAELAQVFGGILWLLILGHYIVDYVFQTEYIAKNKGTEVYPMLAHVSSHALFVYMVTGSFVLGSAELVAHLLIDTAKCAGKLNIHQDQALHILCKIAWVGALIYMVTT